ncbi:MAG: toprim domain-containing protein [Bacillus subtilis]|nr:toprim domain-containing protein [Bacillus subtilis]
MKKLVIVESPSKSRTIEGYLGSEYIVKSSKGHVRGFGKHWQRRPRRRRRPRLRPDLRRHRRQEARRQGIGGGLEEGGRDLSGDRPRPRGRSHLLASVRTARHGEQARPPRHLQRNHQNRHPGGVPASRHRSTFRSSRARKPAGSSTGSSASNSRNSSQRKIKSKSAGRVQSAALRLIVEREEEIQRVPNRGVLRDQGNLRHLRGRPRAIQGQGSQDRLARRSRSRSSKTSSTPSRSSRFRRKPQDRRLQAAVHHLHAPAGGLHAAEHAVQEDDADRAETRMKASNSATRPSV